MDKEVDEIIADELHEKYDYLYDKSYQNDREINDEFDPIVQDKDQDDLLFTTDWSDIESEVLYKRYKLALSKEKQSKEDL